MYHFPICLLDERETLGLISVDVLLAHTLCNTNMNDVHLPNLGLALTMTPIFCHCRL